MRTGRCIYLLHRSRGWTSHRNERGLWISYQNRALPWGGIRRRRCILEEWWWALYVGFYTLDDWLLEVFQVVVFYQGISQQSSHLILMNIINLYNHHWITNQINSQIIDSFSLDMNTFLGLELRSYALMLFETICECIVFNQIEKNVWRKIHHNGDHQSSSLKYLFSYQNAPPSSKTNEISTTSPKKFESMTKKHSMKYNPIHADKSNAIAQSPQYHLFAWDYMGRTLGLCDRIVLRRRRFGILPQKTNQTQEKNPRRDRISLDAANFARFGVSASQ